MVPNQVEPFSVSRYIGMPKYMRVKLELIDRLEGLEAGAPLPSISELMSEYGVALGTVDRALKELTREGRIDVRHGSGIYATGRAQMMQIGICFAFDILEPESGVFPRLLIKSLEAAAAESNNIQCRHYFAAGSGSVWASRIGLVVQDVRARLVDGIIAIGVYSDEFSDLPVPVVGLHALPNVTARVQFDYKDLVRKGVQVLAERGCKRIGYFGGDPLEAPREGDLTHDVAMDHRQARDAFLAEVADLDVETRPTWMRSLPGGDEPTAIQAERDGEAAFDAMIADGDLLPEGIVSTDDHRTIGMYRAMKRHGLVKDIRIASLANRGSATLQGLPVVRLEFNPDDVADALLRTVSGLVTGQTSIEKVQTIKPNVVS